MTAGRVFAIGDIHGCVHALETILSAIDPKPEDQLIVLGDVIDYGRDSAQTINTLMELSRQCDLIPILGNHEEMLLAAFDNAKLRDQWLLLGGQETLNSYRFGATLSSIPDDHIAFLKSFRPYYETATRVYAHANYWPDTPLAETPGHVLRWMPFQPSEAFCHYSGKKAVLGHTEQRDGEVMDLGCTYLIDTYCRGFGWLTALDMHSGVIHQASRWGQLRGEHTITDLKRVRQLLRPPVGEVRPTGEP
jgi:serine/threonine protein phosphatase 1